MRTAGLLACFDWLARRARRSTAGVRPLARPSANASWLRSLKPLPREWHGHQDAARPGVVR
jgi:hypothetical protein